MEARCGRVTAIRTIVVHGGVGTSNLHDGYCCERRKWLKLLVDSAISLTSFKRCLLDRSKVLGSIDSNTKYAF